MIGTYLGLAVEALVQWPVEQPEDASLDLRFSVSKSVDGLGIHTAPLCSARRELTGEIEELWLDDKQLISRNHPQQVSLVELTNELDPRVGAGDLCAALHRVPRGCYTFVSADFFLADRNAGATGSSGGHSRPGHRQFSDVPLAGWAGSAIAIQHLLIQHPLIQHPLIHRRLIQHRLQPRFCWNGPSLNRCCEHRSDAWVWHLKQRGVLPATEVISAFVSPAGVGQGAIQKPL